MTDTTVIREVLPGNTVKRLARIMGASLETAKHWVYREVSPSRRKDVADALLKEMDEQDIARTALRRRLAKWAGEP